MRRFAVALPWLSVLAAATVAGAQEPQSTPPVTVLGFADVDYLETERSIEDGFVLGQVVGHLSAGLSPHLTVFSEVSATARPDAFRIEVERIILRYDFSDRFKLSGGKYHTPISYWNTAFHHGLWLQTTVGRPQMIRFGSRLLPVHFVGVLLEGSFPQTALGLNYGVGFGNGRHDDLARAGESGDANEHRAFLGTVFARPTSPFGLQVGAATYFDRAETDGVEIDERIVSTHAVWARDRPEALVEYVWISHDPETGDSRTSHAGYGQLGWRLSGAAEPAKPYVRYERIDTAANDPLFDPVEADYEALVAGVRYDFSSLAALKAEVRNEDFEGEERAWSLWLQAAFTFGSHEDVGLAGTSGPRGAAR